MPKKEKKHLPTYILRSKYRKEIFFEILRKPYQTQTELLKFSSQKYRSHISRTIKELEENKLIICENPKEKRYKMYFPSEQGKKLRDEITKYGKN